MALDDFDTGLLGDFLSHLETERGNDARTRNTRLAAIRSFFRFVALHEPRYAALAQRVLAIPDKRYTRRPVAFRERDEIDVLRRAPVLHSGVDRAVIALWLGHEGVETTYVYLHADMKLKEQAMARTAPSHLRSARYRPDYKVLAFLNGL